MAQTRRYVNFYRVHLQRAYTQAMGEPLVKQVACQRWDMRRWLISGFLALMLVVLGDAHADERGRGWLMSRGTSPSRRSTGKAGGSGRLTAGRAAGGCQTTSRLISRGSVRCVACGQGRAIAAKNIAVNLPNNAV